MSTHATDLRTHATTAMPNLRDLQGMLLMTQAEKEVREDRPRYLIARAMDVLRGLVLAACAGHILTCITVLVIAHVRGTPGPLDGMRILQLSAATAVVVGAFRGWSYHYEQAVARRALFILARASAGTGVKS